MANRVTATEVKQIMDSCTTSDTVVDVFIGAANSMVTKVYESDTEMTTTMLKDIERWLSAHMIASTVHRSTSEEKLGEASVKYTGYWSQGLSSTPYGQMVQILDVTGKFANYGKRSATIDAIKSFD
jgi:hypothetical protein